MILHHALSCKQLPDLQPGIEPITYSLHPQNSSVRLKLLLKATSIRVVSYADKKIILYPLAFMPIVKGIFTEYIIVTFSCT